MKELFIASLLALARKASNRLDIEDPVTEGSTTSEEPVIVGEDDKAAATEGATEGSKEAPVEVEIPEELKESIFLKVLLDQATILRKEMESTDKNEVPMASCAVDASDELSALQGAYMAMRAI